MSVLLYSQAKSVEHLERVRLRQPQGDEFIGVAFMR